MEKVLKKGKVKLDYSVVLPTLISLVFLLSSCGASDENGLSNTGVVGDGTAPAAINDLTATNPTSSSIELSWTAPGDDVDTGTAASYDVRYSTSVISDTNRGSATKVTGEPTPKAAGTTQSVTVTGLAPETTYYFAIKTADEVPNISDISNVEVETTIPSADTTAPGSINDLTASAPTSNSIDLSWTAPGDDGDTGTAVSYDVRYSISGINDASWSSATRVTGEPTPEAAGTVQSMTVTGLAPETTYYFAIKTADEVPNISDISNVEVETTIPSADTTAPGSINDLTASAPTSSSIELSWTAPGDDGDTGTAVSYDVRYSTSTISDANWSAATRVTGEPTPEVAGTVQSMTVTGLAPETTYYFAIKTADEVPNTSNLSNVVAATTIVSTFNYVMGTTNYGHPTIAEPGQWESYTDPFFNTTIRRISDISDIPGATNIKLSYGRRSYVSSDNRYLLVYATGAGGNPYYIYDLKNRTVRAAPHVTGKVYYGNGGIDAQPEYLWDHSGNYPNRIYYRDGLKFYQADVNYPDGRPDDPNSNILLHDFANEYPNAQVAYNAEKGDSSVDSRYWAFIIRNGAPDHDVEAIITYDKEADTIIGELKNPPLPSWVGMSPDAQYVILANRWKQGGQGSNFDGPHSWKRDFSGTPVKLARDARHNGGGFDVNGNFMFLQMNDSNCRNDNLCATDVADGNPELNIINQSDFEWAGYHLGWHYGSEQRGWVLMEIYDKDETKWGANQMVMLEIKPKGENPRIWRVAHSQDHYTGYASALMSSISQDGTKIYFNSNWHGTDNIEVYEVTLPANWWLDLK